MSMIPGIIIQAAVQRAILLMANNKTYLKDMFEIESIYLPSLVDDFHSMVHGSITQIDGQVNLPVSYDWPSEPIKALPHITVLTRSLEEKDELDSMGDLRGLFAIEAPDEPSTPGGDKTYPERADDNARVIATADKLGHTSIGVFDIICAGQNNILTEMLVACLRGFLFRSKIKLDMDYGIKDLMFESGPIMFEVDYLPSYATVKLLTIRAIVEHYYNPYSMRFDEDEEFWNSVVPTVGSFQFNPSSLSTYSPVETCTIDKVK